MKNFIKVFSYKDLVFRKLELNHINFIKEWGVHESPLLADYNLSLMSLASLSVWVKIRDTSFSNLYYSIFKDGKMIGYVGLKNIKFFRKKAYLGISLDPNFTSKGYGSIILEGFLKYAFENLNLKTIYLDVNAFNERALKLYKKMGFRENAEYLGEFEVPLKDLENLEIIHNEDYFIIYGSKLLSRIIEMKLGAGDWIRRFYET